MVGRTLKTAGSLVVLLATLVVVASSTPAVGAPQSCRPWTHGFTVAEHHVDWSTLKAFDATNGSSKQTSVTWTVIQSYSRGYEVSGQVEADSLFDFLKVSLNSAIMRTWTSTVGEGLTAQMPPHSSAHAVYQVGIQYVSGSEWSCDIGGRRQWTPYSASAPVGHRFVRTS